MYILYFLLHIKLEKNLYKTYFILVINFNFVHSNFRKNVIEKNTKVVVKLHQPYKRFLVPKLLTNF